MSTLHAMLLGKRSVIVCGIVASPMQCGSLFLGLGVDLNSDEPVKDWMTSLENKMVDFDALFLLMLLWAL